MKIKILFSSGNNLFVKFLILWSLKYTPANIQTKILQRKLQSAYPVHIIDLVIWIKHRFRVSIYPFYMCAKSPNSDLSILSEG